MHRYAPAPVLIADSLRSEIQSGAIAPGAPLRQEDLAARFGVSRMPVRDALVRLETEGLVELLPNRGAFVSKLSSAEIGEIYDLRILLESDLLSRAVGAIEPGEIAAVERLLAEAEREAAGDAWHALDLAFHERLYAAAGRGRQLEMVMGLRRTVHRYAQAYEQLPEQTHAWLADHREILAAVRRRDARGAADLLESHLRRAQLFVLDAWNRIHDAKSDGGNVSLILRPNCEHCDKDLPPAALDARICTYECTFCAACAECILQNVCPNCGGGFAPRPIRPAKEWRPGLSVAHQPPSEKRVHLRYSKEDIAAHTARIASIPPQDR